MEFARMIPLGYKISFNRFPQIELTQNPVWSWTVVTYIMTMYDTPNFPVFGIYVLHFLCLTSIWK